MFKRSLLTQSILLALAASSAAPGAFAIEATGYIKNETSVFTGDQQLIGEENSALDGASHHDRLMKFENSARIFLNGDVAKDTTWHGELNLVYDTQGVNRDYKGHENYTQNDWLRELYVDTKVAGWDLRLGKQQLVWGTADGIKLLDIINPTDWREFTQNTMEDSRIPIWMARAEREIGSNSSLQFVVSQVEENKIPGLNGNGDSGQPFIMKGVDSITGQVNGFLNVAPALARVATSFNTAANLGMIGGTPSPLGLAPVSGMTVDYFASSALDPVTAPGAILLPGMPGYNAATAAPGYMLLNNIAQHGLAAGDPNGNNDVTNLMPVTGTGFTDVTWNPANARSAFEYMSNATFATFNTFDGARSTYVRDYPNDANANAGFRLKHGFDNGLNLSLNYFNHYSANPSVTMSWRDPNTGENLQVVRATSGDFINNATGAPGPDGQLDFPDLSTNLTPAQVPTNLTAALPVSILLRNAAGQYYGTYPTLDNTTGALNGGLGSPELRFTESLHRMNSFGSAFDYSFDTKLSPVVVRGEFLYDRGDLQPVIDKKLLAIGDLTNALTMEKVDYFKYVIGVDVTVLTNMMVSAQFIQFRNLDYVNHPQTCTTQTGIGFDCSRYTGDMATLSMTNGMNRAEKNKEFYSLFFSKPFGPSQEHRWNNILMYEENGGYWNRFDVEYSFTDKLIGSGEVNAYWGDQNTMFGQFKHSSNLQVGIKYLFD